MLRLFHYFTQFKIVRYLMSGGTAAVLHIGTVWVLTEIYTVWYLAATVMGFLLAVSVNFVLQKFWTFRDHGLKKTHTQSAGFFVVNGINFVLNGALMILFVEWFDLWPVAAQFCASILIAFESFIAYSFIFRKRAVVSSPPEGEDEDAIDNE